jgi:hypothetical protein
MAQLRRIPDDFSILAGLLEKKSCLDDDLDTGEGPYTLFAPTNTALLLSIRRPLSTQLIQYHFGTLNFVRKWPEQDHSPRCSKFAWMWSSKTKPSSSMESCCEVNLINILLGIEWVFILTRRPQAPEGRKAHFRRSW